MCNFCDIIELNYLIMYNYMSKFDYRNFLFVLFATRCYLNEFKRGKREKNNGD